MVNVDELAQTVFKTVCNNRTSGKGNEFVIYAGRDEYYKILRCGYRDFLDDGKEAGTFKFCSYPLIRVDLSSHFHVAAK